MSVSRKSRRRWRSGVTIIVFSVKKDFQYYLTDCNINASLKFVVILIIITNSVSITRLFKGTATAELVSKNTWTCTWQGKQPWTAVYYYTSRCRMRTMSCLREHNIIYRQKAKPQADPGSRSRNHNFVTNKL